VPGYRRSSSPAWGGFSLRSHIGWLLVLVMALTMGACGDDAATTATDPPSQGFPVTVRGVTIAAEPQRIASLSATHTEIVYALGAGDRVVATDLFSTYPPEASGTEKVDSFSLNVEAVAVLDPDLVLLAFDPGDVVEGLAALGVPTLLFDAPLDLDGAYRQMIEVGDAIGAPEEAAALVAGIEEEIDALVSRFPEAGRGATYFHELDATLFTVTSDTFVGSIYGLLGMENVADPADQAGFGYPQLSAEYLLDADPDFIFLADTAYGESAGTVASRPGWDRLSAVRGGRVIELDGDVASRWGPRLVDLVERIVSAVEGTPGET